jgi:hypothetical protein
MRKETQKYIAMHRTAIAGGFFSKKTSISNRAIAKVRPVKRERPKAHFPFSEIMQYFLSFLLNPTIYI